MKLKIKPFSQRNKKWGNLKLGTSNVKIKDYGCLLVSLTCIADYYGCECTPETLNLALTKVKGFHKGSYYIWNSLNKIYPNIRRFAWIHCPNPVTKSQFKEIEEHLDEGHLLIFRVDFDTGVAGIQDHFCPCIGYSGGSYYVMDPWDGKVKSVTAFGMTKKTIQDIYFYKGEALQGEPEGEPVETMNEETHKKIHGIDESTDQLNLPKQFERVSTLEKEIKTLRKQSKKTGDNLALLEGVVQILVENSKHPSDEVGSFKGGEVSEDTKSEQEVVNDSRSLFDSLRGLFKWGD